MCVCVTTRSVYRSDLLLERCALRVVLCIADGLLFDRRDVRSELQLCKRVAAGL